jgi:hypothetical protein
MAHVLEVDEGQLEADAPLIDKFRDRYNEDISGHQLLRTPVKWLHARAATWYRLVLLTPLLWLVALACCWRRFWRPMLLLGTSVVGLLLVDTMLVTEPVVRYLHSIAWLAVLMMAVIVQGLCGLIARTPYRRAPAT